MGVEEEAEAASGPLPAQLKGWGADCPGSGDGIVPDYRGAGSHLHSLGKSGA